MSKYILNIASAVVSFRPIMLYLVLVTKVVKLSNGTKILLERCINNTPNDVYVIEQNNPNDTSNILDFPSRCWEI